MGTNQSSLASKNTTVENKSTLKSALFSGKRGRKEFQTSSDDLVIVEKPIVENKSAVGSVTDYEGSDSESDDEYDEEWESFRKERELILMDAKALKQLAFDYSHPEAPVTTSAECYGRNYFSRPSAPEQEGVEEAEERAAILADAAALKKLAVMYAHPEAPVTTSAECYGRNYFSRPSAPVPTESVHKNTSQVQPKTVLPNVQKTVKVAPPMGPETDDITRSASSVQLYGLDSMDNQAF